MSAVGRIAAVFLVPPGEAKAWKDRVPGLSALDGETLTIGDYTPARMAEAMMSAHYPLQALLYAVAVHRMLRWRQPGYDPAVHLGGVLYLFVRGMAGPETPRVGGVPCGVFSWQPPTSLVVELSALLDGVSQ